ncbi:type II secretion system protein [Okeanomitos corallinicola TIOX110]|uniref:Type II secretion system protein n=1 Tax=Okeanomitos corallinicola TIOX110 TaxID=3133117 RepID=A0ABZ2USP2_9CYAN
MKSQIKKIKSDFVVEKGFTLIELLVATVIMSLVVTLAGTAFVSILQQNKKAEFETQRRTNLNRALDYIANEIRMANTISAGSDSEVMSLTIPTLTINYPVGVTNPTPNDALSYEFDNSNTVTYSIGDSTGVWADNSNPPSKSITRNGNFIVDAIKAPVREGNPLTCPNGTVYETTSGTCIPNCADGSTLSPADPVTGRNGFYACIYDSGNKADLYLYGKLSDDTSETMEVKSTVFTRAESVN